MELNKISGDNFEKIKLIVFEILDGSKDLLDILVADLFEYSWESADLIYLTATCFKEEQMACKDGIL